MRCCRREAILKSLCRLLPVIWVSIAAGSLEISSDLRKIAREQPANFVFVDLGRLMLGLQLDEHVGILRAGAVGLVVREVVGNRQSDIIADALDLGRRNDAANVLFEPIDHQLGVLDARAARHLDVQAHHAGVDVGKEILAGNQQQAHRCDHRNGDANESQGAPRDEHRQVLAIAIEKAVEPVVEPAHETIPAARALMRLGFLREQMMRHGGDQRSREEIRGQHRVDDGERERGEEKLRDAGEQRDRKKYDADGERADQGGGGNLMGAVENRDQQRLTHRVIAMDVLDLDGGVIDHFFFREGETTESHDVEGLAGELEEDDGGENRERYRRDDDKGAARGADEDEHHQGDQYRGDDGLADDLDQRASDEGGLVESERHLEALGRGSENLGNLLFHIVNYRQSGSIGVFDNHQVGSTLPIDAYHVGLRLMRIGHRRYITDVNRRTIGNLNGKLVEVGHRVRAHVEVDVVLVIAHLGGTRRDYYVGGGERVSH